jgi:hypothetical protein
MADLSAPGIFNASDYGMYPGNTPALNTGALQAAIDAAQFSGNPNGAVVLIPSFDDPASYGNYELESVGGTPAITIPGGAGYDDAPLLICGTGTGTALQMLTSGTLFELTNANNVTFQDLTVRYSSSNTGTAFDFEGSVDCSLFRVNIVNCENSVVLNNTKNTRMLSCIITYGEHFSSAMGVQIAGSDGISIVDGVIRYDHGLAGTGVIGVMISSSSSIWITNNQLTGFGHGIQIGASSGEVTSNVFVSNATIETRGPCIEIAASTYNARFLGCHFAATNDYSGSGPGISIGEGAVNSEVDTVAFTSCRLNGNTGSTSTGSYGMQIYAGQNIQINGGIYTGNGGTGGITILGGSVIQINGASCIGFDIQGDTHNSGMELFQLYGIWICGGQDIQIIGVNCSGNGLVDAAGSGIQIDTSVNETPINNVRIIDAICINPVSSAPTTQNYGIYLNQVSGYGAGILISGCTLSGNADYGINVVSGMDVTISSCDLYDNTQGIAFASSTNAFVRDCNIIYPSSSNAIVFASTGLTNVQVTDCSGYNDQQTVLLLSTVFPSGPFDGKRYGYYGPFTAYVTGAEVSVETSAGLTSTGLGPAAFPLGPGDVAEIMVFSSGNILILGN